MRIQYVSGIRFLVPVRVSGWRSVVAKEFR